MSSKRTNTKSPENQREKIYGLRSHWCDGKARDGGLCYNKVGNNSDHCAAGHRNKIRRLASKAPIKSIPGRSHWCEGWMESAPSIEDVIGSSVEKKGAKVPEKPMFEYGIGHRELKTPHRTGMTERQAHTWLAEWLRDGGKPDVFYVIRRQRSPWEQADE